MHLSEFIIAVLRGLPRQPRVIDFTEAEIQEMVSLRKNALATSQLCPAAYNP